MCAEMKPIDPNTDPNMTIDVKNEELESLMVRYASEKNAECLNALVNHLHNCRVLVPANLNDKKQPIPCFIRNADGKLFMPLYTSKTQIPKEPKSPAILNVPYPAVNQMAANPDMKVEGIVINPFSNNLVFKMELVKKIDEVDKKRAAAPKMKAIKMSAKEYAVFERKQFELRFLPKKFFDEGKTFMEELCSRKEEYIDSMFEESYQQKRMYPYLVEDFSVMVMNISEELQIVRLDMPNRDLEDTACRRIFFVWNQTEEKGRYITIEKAGKGSVLAEVTSDWKHVNLGEAPVEGAELQRVIDLIEDEKYHTS